MLGRDCEAEATVGLCCDYERIFYAEATVGLFWEAEATVGLY